MKYAEYRAPSLSNPLTTFSQQLPQVPPQRIRPRQPSSRSHNLSSTRPPPRHEGQIHLRKGKGHLRAQHGAQRDLGEGSAAAQRERREAQEGDQEGQEFERECERYLESFPRTEIPGVKRWIIWRTGTCTMMQMYRYQGNLGFALGGVYCVLDGYQFKRLLSSTHRSLEFRRDKVMVLPLTASEPI